MAARLWCDACGRAGQDVIGGDRGWNQSVTLLANGGEIAFNDICHSLEQRRPGFRAGTGGPPTTSAAPGGGPKTIPAPTGSQFEADHHCPYSRRRRGPGRGRGLPRSERLERQ